MNIEKLVMAIFDTICDLKIVIFSVHDLRQSPLAAIMRAPCIKILLISALLLFASFQSKGQSEEILSDVLVYSYGCFRQDTTRLVIIKASDHVSATLHQRKGVRTLTLTNDQFKGFEAFVKRLKKLKGRICLHEL